MRGWPARTLALALLLALTGCSGVKPGDLFILTRANSASHAGLTLLINEEGGVHCNGGRELKLSDPALVQARGIQEDLHEAAAAHTVLSPRAGSVYTYSYRAEAGTVTFSDNSPGQSAAMRELQLFVLQTAQRLCGIAA